MEILARAKRLILTPAEEWRAIAAESAEPKALLRDWVAPLALVPAVCGFIGTLLVARFIGAGYGFHLSFGSILAGQVLGFVVQLVGVVVFARIVTALAPQFGGTADPVAAMKLAAYAPTAAWLAGVFLLLPPLAILGLAGLYSLYLLHLGAGLLCGVPRERAMGFTAALVVCGLVVNLALSWLVRLVV